MTEPGGIEADRGRQTGREGGRGKKERERGGRERPELTTKQA